MATHSSPQATVRHTPLQHKKVPDALAEVDNVCTAGSGCALVTNDPIANQALLALKTSVTNAQTSLGKRLQAAATLAAAIKTLSNDVATVHVTLLAYESAINVLAKGDAAVIRLAGLLSREPNPPQAALTKVSVVHTKLGKNAGEAIITWPKAPGATGYAIEVNFTPSNASAPWTALNSGTGRRRIVKGPTPGAQFLVRIASLGSDGTQADWSDAILATAR